MGSDRQYELVYILAPTATDAEVEAQQVEIAEFVKEFQGDVEKTDVWGRRKLAYEIGNHVEGFYVVQLLKGPAGMVSELGRRLRVRDQVLRHLIVRVDEDLRKIGRAAEKRRATIQRRRSARGMPPLPEVDEVSVQSKSPADDDAGAESDGSAKVGSVSENGSTETAKETPSEVQE